MAKYVIIYRKAQRGIEPLGDLSDVRVGDAVSYRDANGAHATSRVAKVNVRAQLLRTEPQMYKEYVLRPGKQMKFEVILELLRIAPENTDVPSSSPIMDIVHPLPPQPNCPKPEVVPVDKPKKRRMNKPRSALKTPPKKR